MGRKNLLLIIVFFGFLFLTLTGVKQRAAKINHKNNSEDTVEVSTVPHTFKLKLNTKSLEWYKRKHELVDLKEKKRKDKGQKILAAWFKQIEDKEKKEQLDNVIRDNRHQKKHIKKAYKTLNNVLLTEYVAYCKGCSGITYSGFDVRDTVYHNGLRIIAVDRNIIKLGSIVKIIYPNGNHMKAIAGDVGGAINGLHVDLLVKSRSKAIKDGRQHVTIKVLRNGK